MNLDFRLVLHILDAISTSATDEVFDAVHASSAANRFLLFTQPDAFVKNEYSKVTVKRMPDYLDLLFKMGFLNRRRTIRKVTTRRGKRCNRGYKYEYRFSKQGLQYLEHIRNPKQATTLYGETLEDMISIEYLRRILPSDLKANAAQIHFAIFGGFNSKGRYRRFPLKEHPVLSLLVKRCERMLKEKDEEISRLREQLSCMDPKGSIIDVDRNVNTNTWFLSNGDISQTIDRYKISHCSLSDLGVLLREALWSIRRK
jgi:hypothetical protein